MNPDRQLAIDYLRAPSSGLWRWADGGTVVVWQDGSTIAFREELVPMLEWLRPQGLPSFGVLVLLLAALRGKLPMPGPLLGTPGATLPPALGAQAALLHGARRQFAVQLEAALAELRKVAQLPSELQSGLTAKCVLAEALLEHARSERHVDAAAVVQGWSEVIPEGVLNETLAGAARNEVRHIHLLAEGLKAHSVESLALRLRTGLDALPTGAGPDLPPSERARWLIEEMVRDPEHGAVARAAWELMAAVRLPRHLGEHEELAIGGVADLSNRGPLDRLLLSELAHDDLTLAVRVALNEALFLRREPPVREPPGTLGLLIDSGIRLWGVPRLFASAVALALVAGGRQHTQLLAWRARGRDLQPVDLLSRHGLAEHLAALEVEAHPGAALGAFAAALPTGPPSQTVLITHRDVMGDPDFRRALSLHPGGIGFIATVDRTGRFELHALPLVQRRPLCEATLDLASLFDAPSAAASLVRPDQDARLPAIFWVSPFPLLLPFAGVVDRSMRDREGMICAVLRDGRLVRWQNEATGGRLLACGLPPGDSLCLTEQARTIHVVKGGTPKRPARLVSVPGLSGEVRVIDLVAGGGVLAAEAAGEVILLMRRQDVRAFSLPDGRPLGHAVHSYRWVHGRFFASPDRFYHANWDGQRVRLDPVSLPLAYSPSVIALIFDRPGHEGPWLLHRSGDVISAATGERLKLPLPRGADFHIETGELSADGRVLLASAPALSWSGVLDLESGECNEFPEPLLSGKSSVFTAHPALPAWNLYRAVSSISASAGRGIALCGRKGRWREIRFEAEIGLYLRDAPSTPDDVRHCLVFSACPIPSRYGCRLQVATWVGGSKVFLDSRGLLHLKSHDPSLPEVSLVLADGQIAGWTSDGCFCGPSFFLGGQSSDPARVYARIYRFLARL